MPKPIESNEAAKTLRSLIADIDLWRRKFPLFQVQIATSNYTPPPPSEQQIRREKAESDDQEVRRKALLESFAKLIVFYAHDSNELLFLIDLKNRIEVNARPQSLTEWHQWKNRLESLAVPLEVISDIAPQTNQSQTSQRENDAQISYMIAIQQCPELSAKPLRDVYNWIKENGVEFSGKEYNPPAFDTWARYRREGAKRMNSSDTT